MQRIKPFVWLSALALIFAVLPSVRTTSASAGTIGQWEYTTALAATRTDFAITRTETHVYLVGGCIGGCTEGATDNVQKAALQGNGELGAWQDESELNFARYGAAAVFAGNYLYVLGGLDGSYLNSVERALINEDGTLEDWEPLNSMLYARAWLQAVVVGPYVYALGGSDGEASTTVQRAEILANGTLSTWAEAPSFYDPRIEFGSFATDDYLYVLAGQLRSEGKWVSLQSIERAPINENGLIGVWEMDGIIPIARHSFNAVYTRGDLYIISGLDSDGDTTTFLDSVDKAVVNANGTVGSWQAMPAIQTARGKFGSVIMGNYLYSIGGNSAEAAPNDNLSSIERAAISVDNTPPIIDSFSINGGAMASTVSNVTLSVTASDDPYGPGLLRFSNDGITWTPWGLFAADSDWVLASGDGDRSVYTQVKDLAGNISLTTEATIEVDSTVGPENGITINEAALFTNHPGVELTISAQAGTAQMQVSNDGGFASAVWEPFQIHRNWTITQFGNYVIPRVTYVRFKNVNGTVSSTYQDDIILDVTPPEGSVQAEQGGSQVAGSIADGDVPVYVSQSLTSTQKLFMPLITFQFCGNMPVSAPNFALRLDASDEVSGVSKMQISTLANFDCAEWQAFEPTVAWFIPASADTIYVKFQDHAGNISEVTSDSVEH